MRVLLINVLALMIAINLENAEGKMSFEQLKNAAKAVRKTCQKASGCPDELIDNAKVGDFPPVKELQCYFKCLFTKMKVIKNDKISWSDMNEQMDLMLNADLAKKFSDLVEVCSPKVTSEDVCEATYQYVLCGWDVDSSMYFFP